MSKQESHSAASQCIVSQDCRYGGRAWDVDSMMLSSLSSASGVTLWLRRCAVNHFQATVINNDNQSVLKPTTVNQFRFTTLIQMVFSHLKREVCLEVY